jgi:hypothetical protein
LLLVDFTDSQLTKKLSETIFYKVATSPKSEDLLPFEVKKRLVQSYAGSFFFVFSGGQVNSEFILLFEENNFNFFAALGIIRNTNFLPDKDAEIVQAILECVHECLLKRQDTIEHNARLVEAINAKIRNQQLKLKLEATCPPSYTEKEKASVPSRLPPRSNLIPTVEGGSFIYPKLLSEGERKPFQPVLAPPSVPSLKPVLSPPLPKSSEPLHPSPLQSMFGNTNPLPSSLLSEQPLPIFSAPPAKQAVSLRRTVASPVKGEHEVPSFFLTAPSWRESFQPPAAGASPSPTTVTTAATTTTDTTSRSSVSPPPSGSGLDSSGPSGPSSATAAGVPFKRRTVKSLSLLQKKDANIGKA